MKPYRQGKHEPLPTADVHLENLVADVEDAQCALYEVTLLVGGAVISGTIVPASAHWSGRVELLERSAAAAGVDQESIERITRRDRFDAAAAAASAEDLGEDKGRPSYIHLATARFAFGQRLIPDEGMHVRLRIDRIDGWGLGRLGTPEHFG